MTEKHGSPADSNTEGQTGRPGFAAVEIDKTDDTVGHTIRGRGADAERDETDDSEEPRGHRVVGGQTVDNPDDDTEGHAVRWSDETLKQAIAQVTGALTALQQLDTQPQSGTGTGDSDDDTEGHAIRWSDETLKCAIVPVAGRLAGLFGMRTAGS